MPNDYSPFTCFTTLPLSFIPHTEKTIPINLLTHYTSNFSFVPFLSFFSVAERTATLCFMRLSIFEKYYQPEPQLCIEYTEQYCRRKNITHGAGAAKISGAQRWWSKTLLHTEPELQNLTQKETVLQKSKTQGDGTAKNWVKKSLQHCLFFLHFNLAALCKYGPQKLS